MPTRVILIVAVGATEMFTFSSEEVVCSEAQGRPVLLDFSRTTAERDR